MISQKKIKLRKIKIICKKSSKIVKKMAKTMKNFIHRNIIENRKMYKVEYKSECHYFIIPLLVYLSIYLFVYLFVYLFIYLFIYLFVRLFLSQFLCFISFSFSPSLHLSLSLLYTRNHLFWKSKSNLPTDISEVTPSSEEFFDNFPAKKFFYFK